MSNTNPLEYARSQSTANYTRSKLELGLKYSVKKNIAGHSAELKATISDFDSEREFNLSCKYKIPKHFKIGGEETEIKDGLYDLMENALRAARSMNNLKRAEEYIKQQEGNLSDVLFEEFEKLGGDREYLQDNGELTKQLNELKINLIKGVTHLTNIGSITQEGFESYLKGERQLAPLKFVEDISKEIENTKRLESRMYSGNTRLAALGVTLSSISKSAYVKAVSTLNYIVFGSAYSEFQDRMESLLGVKYFDTWKSTPVSMTFNGIISAGAIMYGFYTPGILGISIFIGGVLGLIQEFIRWNVKDDFESTGTVLGTIITYPIEKGIQAIEHLRDLYSSNLRQINLKQLSQTNPKA